MKKLILLLLLGLVTTISKAQELESILLASKDDASKLTSAYINPAMKGLIYGMNSGWYHTAKVHKKLGFDISIGANLSIAPTEDELMVFADLGLTSISSSSTTSPTLNCKEGEGTAFIGKSSLIPDGISNDAVTF